MSQNIPFIFGAGGGQLPPPLPPRQQQYPNPAPPNSLPQTATTMAQQAAFQQIPQLAGIDMSVLEGISPHQVAAIFQLFQAGALRPAPPELSAPVPSSLPPAAPQHEVPKVQANQHQEHLHIKEQDIYEDKDEGEIEEIEPDTMVTGRGFLHPPPTGPRHPNANKRKHSPHPPISTPPVDRTQESRLRQHPAPHVNGDAGVAAEESKELTVKKFVLALLKEGHSFDDIAKEVGSPYILAHIFTQMRLDVPARYSSTTKAKTVDNVATKLPTKRPAPAKPAAPAKPVDRSEYLARLQALKNKKTGPTSVATAASNVETKADEVFKKDMQDSQQSSVNVKAKNTNSKAELKTALVRQRLEALKAQHAARQNAALQPTVDVSMSSPVNNATTTSSVRESASSPSHAGLGAGLDEVATRATQMSSAAQRQPPSTSVHQVQGMQSTQPVISPPPPTPTRTTGGLPGLFMFDQSTQVQDPAPRAAFPSPATPQQQRLPFSSYQTNMMAQMSQGVAEIPKPAATGLSVARKRPVASDFDYPTTRPKRTFGFSRGNSADESVIITISDDEDDDGDDDADDEMDTDSALAPRGKAPTSSFREAAPLPDFRQRPSMQTQVSGQSTPGRSSPGGVTLEQKNKEIEEMKRKIAEKEKRRKAANGKVLAAQTAGIATSADRLDAPSRAANGSSGSTPKVLDIPLISGGAFQGLLQSDSQTRVEDPSLEAATERPISAAALARRQEKEQLKQRIRELQQAELQDVNEAVEAAADEPEAPNERSENLSGSVVEVESTPVVQETQATGVAAEELTALETEEGEISDDSLFNFYSPDDAEGTPVDEPAGEDVPKDGTQTSGASDRSDDDEMSDLQQHTGLPDSQPAIELPDSQMGTQLSDSVQQDTDMIEPRLDIGSHESQPVLDRPASPMETQFPDSMEQYNSISDTLSESGAPYQLMAAINQQDEEESSDSMSEDPDSEDEDIQGSDDRLPDNGAFAQSNENQVETPAEPDAESKDSDSYSEDNEDLDQSYPNKAGFAQPNEKEWPSPAEPDTESEDYEPSSPTLMEATPETAEQIGQSATPAAQFGPGTIEPAMKDNVLDHDLAPELQPLADDQPQVPNQASIKSHFKPYESALRGFKDYKWHPDFLATTSQGFNSPSFSHKIDPDTPLCPFEGAGGQCNDPTCQFQHFKDMGLTDTELLKLLGSHNVPAHSPEEHRRWNNGMGAVIQQLRAANLHRDVNAIAVAILEFRKEFLGDATKVLNLG